MFFLLEKMRKERLQIADGFWGVEGIFSGPSGRPHMQKKSKSFFLSDVKLCNLFLASHYFITFIMKLLLELIWSSIMGTLDVQ